MKLIVTIKDIAGLSTLILFLVLILTPHVSAAMDPVLKECLQRGYEVTREEGTLYCVFPDSSRCPLEAFNENACGQEFFTQDYCVREGNPVWEDDLCCSGTQAYIPPNHAGQKLCRDVSFMQKLKDTLFYRPILRYTLIIVFSMSVGIGIWYYRQQNKK